MFTDAPGQPNRREQQHTTDSPSLQTCVGDGVVLKAGLRSDGVRARGGRLTGGEYDYDDGIYTRC